MMKKQTFQLLVLTGMMATLFYGCQKDSMTQHENGEENIIFFDDPTLLENISPNFYDNHIYRIELLGNNDELCDLISRVSDEGIRNENLNIYGSKKHLFNNSEVIMYSIPYNNSESEIVVYQYDDIAEFAVASFEEEGNLDRFTMKTTDGALFYSLQVNEKGQFGNIVTSFNPLIESFSAEVYESQQLKLGLDDKRTYTKTKTPSCCRKADGLTACIDCITSAFSNTFLGTLALGVYGIGTYIAIGVSCINAGPGAVC
jgi:hypothetical protein